MIDNEMLKYYLQSIEELVEDENKVLTYSSLANNFSISINLAKHLLELYMKNHENEKLQVTYCLCGIRKDTNDFVMDIVKSELISEWITNVSILISRHVFSICKDNKNNLDSLYFEEPFNDYVTQKSIITSDQINKISEESLLNLREIAYKKVSRNVPKQLVAKNNKSVEQPGDGHSSKAIINEEKSKHVSDQINNVCENQDPNKIIVPNQNTSQIQGKQPSNKNNEKKNSITSMFAAQSNQKSTKIINNSNDNIPNKKAKGIQGFFQKQNKVNNIHNVKIQNHGSKMTFDHCSGQEIIGHLENVKVETVAKEKMDEFVKKDDPLSQPKSTETLKVKKSSKPIATYKSSSKKNKNSAEIKKRKRVISMSDSDSDNDHAAKLELSEDPFEDNNTLEEHISSEDEVIPPTPQVSTGRVTLKSNAINPRKKRKVVDKTYTDEDGYILTKKEIVYESCSENEEATENSDINIKKSANATNTNTIGVKPVGGSPTKVKNKIILQGKNKQATLTNFFKKT